VSLGVLTQWSGVTVLCTACAALQLEEDSFLTRANLYSDMVLCMVLQMEEEDNFLDFLNFLRDTLPTG